jgi:vacuole morphology and inheritance protein 14
MINRNISTMTTRSKLGREDIKWQELLSHFRTVQAKHEKARRQALGADNSPFTELTEQDKLSDTGGATRTTVGSPAPTSGRPQIRRKVTGEINTTGVAPRPAILSPLNPRARQTGLMTSALTPVTRPVGLGNLRNTIC